MVSIIVPALNEERRIGVLLDHLEALEGAHEVIVADGGSRDRTATLAAGRAKLVRWAPGRGIQCNAGAAQAAGDILLFLHADCRLERDALAGIQSAIRGGARWGCLRLRFDEAHILTKVGAFKSGLRARYGRIVFGDQGMFFAADLFREMGGFPALPLMEDYQLSLDLREKGIRPAVLPSAITTSARRFRQVGRLRLGWRMHRMRHLYRKGVDVEAIADLYRRGTG